MPHILKGRPVRRLLPRQAAALRPTGFQRTAIPLLALLATFAAPSPAGGQNSRPVSFAGLVRDGDAHWTAGRYAEAGAAYTAALEIDSGGSSRAVYRLGVLRSWNNRLVPAIELLRRYVRLEPQDEEGRIMLARVLAWKGDYVASIALYDSILVRDRTYRAAALGAAQTFAWAGRMTDALARYRDWLREHGDDQEAALANARTLAWAGKLRASEQEYLRLEVRGDSIEAAKGLALVAAWRGDLRLSESRWKRLTTRIPRDPEVWVGLAQVQRWAGRPEEAKAALDQALAANPSYPDAREQLRWVRADLARTIEPTTNSLWDSDGNRTTVISVAATERVAPRVRLLVGAGHRVATLTGSSATSSTGRADARVAVLPWLAVGGELGATVLNADGQSSETKGIAGIRGTLMPWAGLAIGLAAGSRPFDETAPLIRSGLTLRSAGASLDLRLPDRVGVTAGFDRTEIEGGSVPNIRRSFSASMRWNPERRWSIGLSGRRLGHDASPRDGYFAPKRFTHVEGNTHLDLGHDLGWVLGADLGLGVQWVRFTGPSDQRGTQRVGASLSYRPTPGSEVGLSYQFGNVAGATTGIGAGSVYHASVLGLVARVLW